MTGDRHAARAPIVDWFATVCDMTLVDSLLSFDDATVVIPAPGSGPGLSLIHI